jgi:Sec-independent protein translocase protein TatA
MSLPLMVSIAIGVVGLVALLAMTIGLARGAKELGKTLKDFREEVEPLQRDLEEEREKLEGSQRRLEEHRARIAADLEKIRASRSRTTKVTERRKNPQVG